MREEYRHIIIQSIRQVGVIFVLVGALLCAEESRGETVKQKDALRIAQTFYNAAHGEVMAAPKVVYNGRRLTTQSLFVPFYVYNFPAGGYVIVSAENKAYPILGYNLKESFNEDTLGPKEKALLRQYALDIERIRYDDRIPYSAIEAWNNFPGYVSGMLDAKYNVTDVLLDASEVYETIENIVDSDDIGQASVIYTPEQWEEAIDAELVAKGNVAIGIYDIREFQPMVVQGHKGDYYRMSLDGPNSAMYRLFATEIFSDGQVAQLGNPRRIEESPESDTAFLFYKGFIAETEAEEMATRSAIENAGVISEPESLYLGGGHYVVKMPENIRRMNLYNVGGNLISQKYFRGTDIANLDISEEPSGFYIAVIEGESGRNYGIKLAR